MYSPILAPAIVLVLWSFVIMVWMAATRLPAVKKAGVSIFSSVGGRGQDLEGVIPDNVNWKAHNYAHLMEQPTLFYATVFVLVLAGVGTGINMMLAWAYVGLRIVHSLVQCTSNKIIMRFPLFLLSSLVLLAMAVRAALVVI